MLSKDGGEDSYESSYDLSLEFKPISYYVDNHEEMIRQMFKVVGIPFIKSILPKSLNKMPILQLQQACVHKLNNLNPIDVTHILSGKRMTISPPSKSVLLNLAPSSDISDINDDISSIHSNITNDSINESLSKTPSPHFASSIKTFSKNDVVTGRNYYRPNKLHHSLKKSHKSELPKKVMRNSNERNCPNELSLAHKERTTKDPNPLPKKPETFDDRTSSLAIKSKSDCNNKHDLRCVTDIVPAGPILSTSLDSVELELRAKAIQAMMAHKKHF